MGCYFFIFSDYMEWPYFFAFILASVLACVPIVGSILGTIWAVLVKPDVALWFSILFFWCLYVFCAFVWAVTNDRYDSAGNVRENRWDIKKFFFLTFKMYVGCIALAAVLTGFRYIEDFAWFLSDALDIDMVFVTIILLALGCGIFFGLRQIYKWLDFRLWTHYRAKGK